jgi:hypothetical protein
MESRDTDRVGGAVLKDMLAMYRPTRCKASDGLEMDKAMPGAVGGALLMAEKLRHCREGSIALCLLTNCPSS